MPTSSKRSNITELQLIITPPNSQSEGTSIVRLYPSTNWDENSRKSAEQWFRGMYANELANVRWKTKSESRLTGKEFTDLCKTAFDRVLAARKTSSNVSDDVKWKKVPPEIKKV